MQDLADHPFSSEAIAYESGAPDRAERAWLKWTLTAKRALGHSLDGDDSVTAILNGIGEGFSLDEAYDAWEDGSTAAEYVAMVRRRPRYQAWLERQQVAAYVAEGLGE